ncbi:MAG: peptidoglycan editing factor PgeF [Ruminococcaceae bacterium]|nr:peptidoglycan editing factor PgeF [Oscillospiraceae bacterium]
MKFLKETKNNIEYYTVPELTDAGFHNMFTTKLHGHSFPKRTEGGELNFGTNCNDTEEAILKNYTDVLNLWNLSPDQGVKSKQTHSDITLTVDKSYGGEGILREQRYPEADGLITKEKDLAILIFFADCVPILIGDKKQKICAAIHSGWKGTYKNIVGKAVEQLINNHNSKPEDLLCAIGPSIGPCHFEVSQDLYEEMTSLYGDDTGLITDNKYYLDLKKTVKKQLISHKVLEENIAVSTLCTVCEESLYSFRREGEASGRMAAFIALKNDGNEN